MVRVRRIPINDQGHTSLRFTVNVSKTTAEELGWKEDDELQTTIIKGPSRRKGIFVEKKETQ